MRGKKGSGFIFDSISLLLFFLATVPIFWSSNLEMRFKPFFLSFFCPRPFWTPPKMMSENRSAFVRTMENPFSFFGRRNSLHTHTYGGKQKPLCLRPVAPAEWNFFFSPSNCLKSRHFFSLSFSEARKDSHRVWTCSLPTCIYSFLGQNKVRVGTLCSLHRNETKSRPPGVRKKLDAIRE